MSHIEVEPIIDVEVYADHDYMDYMYYVLILFGVICLLKNLKT